MYFPNYCIILLVKNEIKCKKNNRNSMPDTDWSKYVIKRPLPTYKEKIDGVEAKLDEWVKGKHYCRHGLKLNDVAVELGIFKGDISNCVNARKKMNFSAWINSLRIEDAKKMIQKNLEISLYEVGYKVGHPNSNTFRKTFTQFAGCTPEEWIEQCKSE